MKKPFQTTLIAIAASVALAFIALAIVPLVLKDQVAKLVRSELNERLDAATEGLDVPDSDRELMYGQMLAYFNDHGVLPEFTINKVEP